MIGVNVFEFTEYTRVDMLVKSKYQNDWDNWVDTFERKTIPCPKELCGYYLEHPERGGKTILRLTKGMKVVDTFSTSHGILGFCEKTASPIGRMRQEWVLSASRVAVNDCTHISELKKQEVFKFNQKMNLMPRATLDNNFLIVSENSDKHFELREFSFHHANIIDCKTSKVYTVDMRNPVYVTPVGVMKYEKKIEAYV